MGKLSMDDLNKKEDLSFKESCWQEALLNPESPEEEEKHWKKFQEKLQKEGIWDEE